MEIASEMLKQRTDLLLFLGLYIFHLRVLSPDNSVFGFSSPCFWISQALNIQLFDSPQVISYDRCSLHQSCI